MRLTRQTGHAIRILIDCALAGGRLVKTGEIARRLDITPQNVFKIVHILSKAGFVTSVRGPMGGVRLAHDPLEIRIGDVVRATEITSVEVEGAAAAAGKTGAPINRVLDSALEAFIAVLDRHTLSDMAVAAAAPGDIGQDDPHPAPRKVQSVRAPSRRPESSAARRSAARR